MKVRKIDAVRMRRSICQAEIPPLPGMAPFAPLICGRPAIAHVWIEGNGGQDLCRDHVRTLIRNLEAIKREIADPDPTPPVPAAATIRAAGDALARTVRAYISLSGLTTGTLAEALAAWDAARGEIETPAVVPTSTPSVPDETTIRAAVRAYILAEFLPGEDPAELTDHTPLVTGGILDGLVTAKLLDWLNKRYGDDFGVHCCSSDYAGKGFDSIAAIARTVVSRLAASQQYRTGGPP